MTTSKQPSRESVGGIATALDDASNRAVSTRGALLAELRALPLQEQLKRVAPPHFPIERSGLAKVGTSQDGQCRVGGCSTPAVQRHAVSPEDTSPVEFDIELKAWIPHVFINDPEEPFRRAVFGDNADPEAVALLQRGHRLDYRSRFRGDGHTGYAGGYRVLTSLRLSWNGRTLLLLDATSSCGETHRIEDWSIVDVEGNEVLTGERTERQTALAVPEYSLTQRAVRLAHRQATNPLTLLPAPAIDATLYVRMRDQERIELEYITDQFPSHGMSITAHLADGTTTDFTETIQDVSGCDMSGTLTASLGLAGLLDHSNTGSRDYRWRG